MNSTKREKDKASVFQRLVCGVIGIAGGVIWIYFIISIFNESRTVSLDTALAILLTLPLGFFLFIYIAVVGRFPP